MKKNTLKALRTLAFAIVTCAFFTQCSHDDVLPSYIRPIPTDSLDIPGDGAASADTVPVGCESCTYVVPAGVEVVDGEALGLKPGDVIGLSSEIKYGSIVFKNVVGSPDNPIVIRNCGGTAHIVATDRWHAIRTEYSKYFRITGGEAKGVYGIRVEGGEMGMKLDGLSTNFEVDHVEVFNTGFAGIMAKTDPTCDDATIRGNFTMYDVALHHNYIHDVGGEGFYVGNSFWGGMERSCGNRLPHEIKNLKIHNNVLKNTGWEAIQVGCAIEGTEIFDNTIHNYGVANRPHQNNGIQIGSGTGGLVYNNLVKNGPGNGIIMMGIGDNVVYNNIIVDAGSNGIFADERYTPGLGFMFINNTILSPKGDGIKLYTDEVEMNVVINNIIANPGTLKNLSPDRAELAFVSASSSISLTKSNNIFAHTVDELHLVDPSADNYRLKPTSPAVNFGKNITRFTIEEDFYKNPRKKGFALDAGAAEY